LKGEAWRRLKPHDPRAISERILDRLNRHYLFPENIAVIERGLQAASPPATSRGFDQPERLAESLTRALQQAVADHHLRVRHHPDAREPSDPFAPEGDSEEALEEYRRSESLQNFGFIRVERMAGNIGLLKLRRSVHPFFAGETATAAMNYLASASALIVDVRQCPGGHPAIVPFVISYLVGAEPVHLNDFDHRVEGLTHS